MFKSHYQPNCTSKPQSSKPIDWRRNRIRKKINHKSTIDPSKTSKKRVNFDIQLKPNLPHDFEGSRQSINNSKASANQMGRLNDSVATLRPAERSGERLRR
ncbi:hypothetical protein Sjap_000911 [Stephania japonica]|uniref:Uncharacterized protein n=1 Tax=Stephania japonica TaxID=461633 RepID=A0AAP0PUI9_9MAGN